MDQDTDGFAGLLFDVAPSAIFTVDLEGRITRWNKTAEELTGYSAEEMLGQHCSKFALTPCRERCGVFCDEIRKPISGKECTIRDKAGHVRVIRKNANLIKDKEGKTIGAVECFEDISAQKAAEAQLKFQADFTNSVLESLAHPLYIIDPESMEVMHANSFALDCWGLEEIPQGATCHGLTHGCPVPCDQAGESCPMREVMRTKKPCIVEHEHRMGDGSTRSFEVHAYPVLDSEGAVARVIEYNTDITERKAQKERILRSERNIRTLLESSKDAMVAIDTRGRVSIFNPAAEEMFGWTAKDMLGAPLTRILPPSVRGVHSQNVRGFFTKGSPNAAMGKTVELEACRADGTEFPVELSLSQGGTGKDRFVLAVLRDITGRKAAEEQVRHAVEMKAGFVSMVSHELRTPLTAIKEGIDIVLDGTAGQVGEDQKEFLELAQRNVHRLSRLINDVLNFQKLEAGKTGFRLEEHDLADTVHEVVATMTPVVRAKGLDIRLQNGRVFPKAVFDRDKVIQVLTNLLNNSAKFTEKGGIEVSIQAEEEELRVTVADTGPGIAAQDLPRLFHSFEQFGKAKSLSGGTGLGLAISKQIVLRHKGRIWAESELGKGTRFHFTLPFKQGGDHGAAHTAD